MDWMIEKAVETGVSKITFIKCKHSERDKMNMDRCYKIAISAMKQSKQYWLPEIEDIQPFQKVVEKNTADLKLIAWCNADRKAILRSYITNATQSIVALIGPEGDFDADEIHLAEKNGFQYLYLTPSTLRTETAALYISMAVGAIAQQI
jgi:16S rRNA (uracil1498-N3)-methyltransferase